MKVLFFGATADAVGTRTLEIDSKKIESVAALLSWLKLQKPAIANEKLLVAVNEEYAQPDTILMEGDEIAIFTPVSGG